MTSAPPRRKRVRLPRRGPDSPGLSPDSPGLGHITSSLSEEYFQQREMGRARRIPRHQRLDELDDEWN